MPTNKEEIKETQKQTPKTVSAKKTTSTKKLLIFLMERDWGEIWSVTL